MWTNLGYWAGTRDYAAAAHELARRVGCAARLRPGDVVLDVACGYGDSLRVWLEEFQAGHVIGVEPDPQVIAAVRERVTAWGLQDRVTLLAERAEQVMPDRCEPRPTAVVCVDAAYHFASRCRWLEAVTQALPPGGRLALADLVVGRHAAGARRLRAMARLLDIPPENLGDAERVEDLLDTPTMQVRWCETAGEAVLDGFARYQRRGGLPVAVTRFLVRLARRRRLVDYHIVGAERQSAPLG